MWHLKFIRNHEPLLYLLCMVIIDGKLYPYRYSINKNEVRHKDRAQSLGELHCEGARWKGPTLSIVVYTIHGNISLAYGAHAVQRMHLIRVSHAY